MKAGIIKFPSDFKPSTEITDLYRRVDVQGMFEMDNFINLVCIHRDFTDILDMTKLPTYKPVYVMGIYVGMMPMEV